MKNFIDNHSFFRTILLFYLAVCLVASHQNTAAATFSKAPSPSKKKIGHQPPMVPQAPISFLPSSLGSEQLFSDMRFAHIHPRNGNQEICSPSVQPEFKGIQIAASPIIYFYPGFYNPEGTFTDFLICAAYQLPIDMKNPQKLTFHAVDIKTKKHFSGEYLPAKGFFDNDIPQTFIDPKSFENMWVGGYLNENLLSYVSLPEIPANYEVWLEQGNFQSNHIKVSLQINPNLSKEYLKNIRPLED